MQAVTVIMYMAAGQINPSTNNHEMNISYGGALSCCPTGVLSLAPVTILVVPILGCFGVHFSSASHKMLLVLIVNIQILEADKV